MNVLKSPVFKEPLIIHLLCISQATRVPLVPWGSTKPTESHARLSPRCSSWPWRGSSGKSSTSPLPSGRNSPHPWLWQRPKSRSGSRTEGPKLSGSRRQSWKNSRWLQTPRRQQPQQSPPGACTLALPCRCHWAPCRCTGNHTPLTTTSTTDPCCPSHLWACMPPRWATACTTFRKRGNTTDFRRFQGYPNWTNTRDKPLSSAGSAWL